MESRLLVDAPLAIFRQRHIALSQIEGLVCLYLFFFVFFVISNFCYLLLLLFLFSFPTLLSKRTPMHHRRCPSLPMRALYSS